jgi:hypothetical protein
MRGYHTLSDPKLITEASPFDVNFSHARRPKKVATREVQPMLSRICCPENHSTKGISTWEAAVALSEGRAIGVCKKCGKKLQYRIDHIYANEPSGKQYSCTVTRAIRLGTQLAAGENYAPFLLVLREIKTDREQILPAFWAYGQATRSVSQFPPVLSLAEWKTLFRRLDASFDGEVERIRLRAYELYEKRGKRDGSALADWLQAEAEVTERKSLRAAA